MIQEVDAVYDENTLVCPTCDDLVSELAAVLFEYYILSLGEVCTSISISPDLFHRGGFIVRTQYVDLICHFPYPENNLEQLLQNAYDDFFKAGKLPCRLSSIRINGNHITVNVLTAC